MPLTMERVLLGLAFYLLAFLHHVPVAVIAEEKTDVRLVLFTCHGTWPLSGIWLKTAVDMAMETVEQRLESGIYQNFYLNLRSYEHCFYDVPGIGAELYYREPFDVIMGPPTSAPTIGELYDFGKCKCYST